MTPYFARHNLHMSETLVIADYLNRIYADIVKDISDLTDAQVNRVWPIEDTNTIFAIGTHAVGMAEFWLFSLVGGELLARERSAEFRAQGSAAELVARIERFLPRAHALLAKLGASDLEGAATPPAAFATSGGFSPDAPMSKRDCLMHVVEHSATHLGHIQLARQLVLALDAGVIRIA
jgi:hypothetical protein